jgi:NADH-quinone oxidoreductase subunit F
MIDDRRILIPKGVVVESLEAYQARGGFEGLRKAFSMAPQDIINEIKKSGLRGRGGAGFPTGVKWQGNYDDPGQPKYMLCNFAEGEPGTYKDRYMARKNPYQILEGMAICHYTLGMRHSYLTVKEVFTREIDRMREALAECIEAGVLGPNALDSGNDILIDVVLGPDDYLLGEEKGLIEVVEGGVPMPRVNPPYIQGLFVPQLEEGNPTIVNNAETFAHLSHILREGADWWKGYGSADTAGTFILTLSGDIERPGIYELEMGTPMKDLIYECGGGPKDGIPIKCVFSGTSSAPLQAHQLDTPLDFGGMKKAGSGLGSGGVIVYNEDACMVRVAQMIGTFFSIESAAYCPPCKDGTGQIARFLRKIEEGRGTLDDLRAMRYVQGWVENRARCFLPTADRIVTEAMLAKWPDEFAEHIELGRCPRPRELPLPKLKDYDEETGQFVYDVDYWKKRPSRFL